ncbi:MAG: dihydrofolate reductase [Flavobacteriales bacterium]
MDENPELLPENPEIPQERIPMKIALIVAMGKNREIGRNNQLMWHLAEDMRFFKNTTSRHYVIMGRKNFESIPLKYRPLPDRVNIIVSRDPEYMFEECYTCTSLEEAIDMGRYNGEDRIFIIGGGQIYKLAMEAGLVDEMFITNVNAEFPDADVFFPEFNESEWEREHIQSGIEDSTNEFNFEIYKYTKIPPAV